MLGPVLALLCVFALFATADKLFSGGNFATPHNLRTVVVDNAIIAVAALGMTVIIISGGIDLSAGTAMALCATTLAWGLRADVGFMASHGSNFAAASEDWISSPQELDTAEKRLDSAQQRNRTAEIKRWQTAIAEVEPQVKESKATLKAILDSKLKTTESAVATWKGDKRTSSDLDRWRERSELIQAKLTGLDDPEFRASSDLRWNEGVPNSPMTAPLAVLIGVVTGILTGVLNGVLISLLRLAPFIVTLGTMTIYVGLGNLLSGNAPIRPSAEQRPEWLMNLLSLSSDALFLGAPMGVWLALLMAIAMFLVLRYTVFGRYVFALGSNEATARLCGVNVPYYKIAIYSLGGLFLGLAGIYLFSYVETGNPMDGIGRELKVIAAVVIGGGSLNGGRGTILGALAGVGIMAVIDSGCDQLGLPDQAERILLGAVIIGAATIDRFRQKGQGE